MAVIVCTGMYLSCTSGDAESRHRAICAVFTGLVSLVLFALELLVPLSIILHLRRLSISGVDELTRVSTIIGHPAPIERQIANVQDAFVHPAVTIHIRSQACLYSESFPAPQCNEQEQIK